MTRPAAEGGECAAITPGDLSLGSGDQFLTRLVVNLEREAEFVGQLGIEVEGFDQHDQKRLRIVAMLEVVSSNDNRLAEKAD